ADPRAAPDRLGLHGIPDRRPGAERSPQPDASRRFGVEPGGRESADGVDAAAAAAHRARIADAATRAAPQRRDGDDPTRQRSVSGAVASARHRRRLAYSDVAATVDR